MRPGAPRETRASCRTSQRAFRTRSRDSEPEGCEFLSVFDADLTNARLVATAVNAKFVRANLSHADVGADPRNQPMGLMRTDWTNADLTGANLTGVNLRKAKMVRSNFTDADLTGADLTLADLTDAVFHDIKGRATIKGLDQALHKEDAHFDP